MSWPTARTPAPANPAGSATWVLSSLPGVGQTVLATLLAEAPQALARRDYKALRCMCGVAPVTRRSGKDKLVVRRMAAHARLRDAVYHWARVAVQRDPASKAKYAALRGRGHAGSSPSAARRPGWPLR
ncbi:MAG: IS110 family transposase [Gemmatimonadetes bacterium]|nr:IS110 family transposase [Gemmatimonadota bacterium]MYJ39104.1 IS110 family transposase [Gemmatimonadota bacterium]